MTIHHEHPFADPQPDPLRRLRGRLGGAVTLWTTAGPPRAGLTVTSVMAAGGEPGRLLALVDPDSDLREAWTDGRHAVVQLLRWEHRQVAEAFAGAFPAPGGPFRMGEWVETTYGPRLADCTTWAGVELESTTPVGWSDLVVARVVEVHVGEDDSPLEHRRGRYLRPGEPPG